MKSHKIQTNIKTINFDPKIFNNQSSNSPNKKLNNINHAFQYCNISFKFSYKRKCLNNKNTVNYQSNRSKINNVSTQNNNKNNNKQKTHTNYQQILKNNYQLNSKRNSQSNQESYEFKRIKSANNNRSIIIQQPNNFEAIQQTSKYNYHFNHKSSIISERCQIPNFTQSLHLQRSKRKKTLNKQPSLLKSINDSCKITTISLANPIHNNHKQYLIKKTLPQTHQYHIDVSKQYNLREIYIQDLQKIQLSRVKYERNFLSSHIYSRKKRNKKLTDDFIEDLQPKPWESEEKNSLELFTKDTMI